MKINQCLPGIICILFFSNSYSQTSPEKNKLEFSIGYNFGALKNLEIAPVSRYDYNGPIYKLNYQRLTKKKKIVEVQLDYLQSELKTDLIPALNLEYTKIGLSFSSLKPIYTKNKFGIHLGLQSNSDLSLYPIPNNYQYILDQKLGIASRFSYQINEKHSLFSKLTIPVLLFRVTNSSANVYSLDRYQSVLWNIGYNYSLSNHLDMKLSYDFNYDRLQISNAFREVQYQLNLGIKYKF
ncbi:hypothetical protein IWQ47_002457 [Aquimarina sp. EL_43]|uniref:hypothetical protein n=1 Tax=unclassified Aquimarina TaxID=2627091 RepID=UPI0018C9EA22|nr:MULTISPECIES: hypothetical protein [unclassified Aquimarina]MBG6130987.1 hypothetical protein [Aquimarina sp. EL_35]MBG6151446.1 hypothetical protein [Aquimarina sp. EL_32]MBG6169377.1 hypothetical protein [Aquimarina sp. EL_43]